jgi:hypothetical protein
MASFGQSVCYLFEKEETAIFEIFVDQYKEEFVANCLIEKMQCPSHSRVYIFCLQVVYAGQDFDWCCDDEASLVALLKKSRKSALEGTFLLLKYHRVI